MDTEEAIKFLDTVIDLSINHVQELVFRGAWEEKTYEEMGAIAGYDADYLRDVGSKLWRSLSNLLGEKINKNNFRCVLRRQLTAAKPSGCPKPVNSSKITTSKSQMQNRMDCIEAIDLSNFLGRADELATLEQWIEDRCHLIAIIGMAGIGKTSLAAKMVQRLQGKFDYSICRSLHHAPSLEEIISQLIQFLSNGQETDLPKSLNCKIWRLMHYLRSSRCLLVLDNLESVLQSGDCAGSYREGYEDYAEFFQILGAASHQSCLVVTTREKPRGLAAQEGQTLPVRSMHLASLPEIEIAEILKTKGIYGTKEEIQLLSHRYGGNPLLLKIVATAIQDLFAGDIAEFLAEKMLVFGEIRDILNQQFERLSDVEKQVMYRLAINWNWVNFEELRQQIVPSVSPEELLEVLQSLQRRSLLEKPTLIEKPAVGFTQAPVVREYAIAHRSADPTRVAVPAAQY